jgi:hypothetical protein
MDNKQTHCVKYKFKEDFLAISKDIRFFITLTFRDYFNCSGNMLKRCLNSLMLKEVVFPECSLALFLGQGDNINKTCEPIAFKLP